MVRAYIGLGANIGEPLLQLAQARAALAQRPGVTLAGCSGVYRSKPMGPQDQPDFLNAVAAIDCTLSAHALLDVLQEIEQQLGRRRERRWGPRAIDLDLLLFADENIASQRLTVPHPGIARRLFVLLPLAELCGDTFRLPCGRELGTLIGACPDDDPLRLDVTWPSINNLAEQQGD